jgi:hypothetical protein
MASSKDHDRAALRLAISVVLEKSGRDEMGVRRHASGGLQVAVAYDLDSSEVAHEK